MNELLHSLTLELRDRLSPNFQLTDQEYITMTGIVIDISLHHQFFGSIFEINDNEIMLRRKYDKSIIYNINDPHIYRQHHKRSKNINKRMTQCKSSPYYYQN